MLRFKLGENLTEINYNKFHLKALNIDKEEDIFYR
jgi:hypothetical protein